MRVMVVVRLFSGLAESLTDGVWRPKGVPAVYRLLEGLAAEPDIELMTVFTCKDAYDGQFARGRRLTLDPIGEVVILPWAPRPYLARFGLDGKLREIGHLLRCVWLHMQFRPDTIYFTNANFVTAGVFARFGLGRVVLRFLGLHPEQKRLAQASGGLQRWIYRSPFDRVICSMDGSGGGSYLPKLIAPRAVLSVLLNGVDVRDVDAADLAVIRKEYNLGDRPVVAFIGRLERNKGCREFIGAVIEVLRQRPDAIDAVVVGDGALRKELSGRVVDSGLQNRIRMVGQVSHDQVPAWLEMASIYVSINHYGSLSNANLEAVAAGKCVVVLEKDPETHTDEETEEVLPPGSILRIGRENVEAGLVEALIDLLDTPDRLADYAKRAREMAKQNFTTWEQRVDREIELIRA